MLEQKDESVSAWGEAPEAAKLIETGREPASELQRRSTSRKRQDFLGSVLQTKEDRRSSTTFLT